MAEAAPEVALAVLLGPLRFAARGDNAARLAGFESLVDNAVKKARGAVDPEVLDEIRQTARGFDTVTLDEKRERIRRILAILTPSTPFTRATAPSTQEVSTKPTTGPGAATVSPGSSTVARGVPPASPGSSTVARGVPRSSTKPATATRAAAASTAPATVARDVPPSSTGSSTVARGVPPSSTGASTVVRGVPASSTGSSTSTVPRGDVLSLEARFVKGIGPRRAQLLEERGIKTVGDLLFTLPRTYEDRRAVKRIADLEAGVLAVVSGTVAAAGSVGRRRYEVALDDGSGQLRLVFFHFRPTEMARRFPRGAVVTASGETTPHGPRLQMVHPRVSSGARVDDLGGVQPVYPEMRGMHPLELARCVRAALDKARAEHVVDPLPSSVRSRVVPLDVALVAIHAPKDDVAGEDLRALVERRSLAHRRLAFEELFVLGTALALRRRAGHVDPAPALVADDAESLRALLPFQPTHAQVRAIAEVNADLGHDHPMARMLQGDVGSGKTAVAAAACLRTVRAGFQAAFMAPTELLAEQHGRTLKRLFSPVGGRVEVITGSLGKKARAIAEARLKNRDIDIAVGTQALLSEGVTFARLGLCVVDEQHRFGVVQRAALRAKGPLVNDKRLAPHLLVMTATPIPRSLALTVYGDLAVSVLDELPPGRTPVATQATRDLGRAHLAIAEVLSRGERAFVVYPLIDESEKVDLAAASAGFDELRERFGPSVALLHGRMKSAEREKIMAAFARGDSQVLVSTTVVEVGVDVPEATLMVVVNAERFGLAQLHQLRGRVGRSARSSRCVLVVGGAGEDAMRRVHVLTESNDGFRIAEEDLAIRGPGDVLGTRQSGVPSLAFADLARNAAMIEETRALADRLVDDDPALAKPDNAGLRKLVLERYAARLALTGAG